MLHSPVRIAWHAEPVPCGGPPVRIALAQVDVDFGDVDANIERARKMIASARDQHADLVVFPELHLSGYDLGALGEEVEIARDDERLVDLAALAGPATIIIGFPESSPSWVHTYNSAACFSDGQLAHLHRKLYLPTYGIFEERKHFSPGSNLRAFDLPEVRAAILVCNDAWQPMLPFLAVQDGARLLIHPANSAQSRFPQHYDSATYWRDLSRFYGRMYQSFVVFVNRVGREGELSFFGRSHVVDPWGEFVAEADADVEELLVVEIDLDEVRRRRREIPLLREARLDLLRREIERLEAESPEL